MKEQFVTLTELKSLHERLQATRKFYHEDETGPRLNAWEEAESAFVVAMIPAFPLLCAEVEAARKVRDLTRQFLPATPGAPGSLAEAILEYDAARRATEGAGPGAKGGGEGD